MMDSIWAFLIYDVILTSHDPIRDRTDYIIVLCLTYNIVYGRLKYLYLFVVKKVNGSLSSPIRFPM